MVFTWTVVAPAAMTTLPAADDKHTAGDALLEQLEGVDGVPLFGRSLATRLRNAGVDTGVPEVLNAKMYTSLLLVPVLVMVEVYVPMTAAPESSPIVYLFAFSVGSARVCLTVKLAFPLLCELACETPKETNRSFVAVVVTDAEVEAVKLFLNFVPASKAVMPLYSKT